MSSNLNQLSSCSRSKKFQLTASNLIIKVNLMWHCGSFSGRHNIIIYKYIIYNISAIYIYIYIHIEVWNLIRSRRTSRVPMLRSTPRHIALNLSIFFVSASFFCFTKAVLDKAATFGNYSVHASICKMIPQSAISHRPMFANNPLFFFFFLSPSPLFLRLHPPAVERNACWATQIFKIFRVTSTD